MQPEDITAGVSDAGPTTPDEGATVAAEAADAEAQLTPANPDENEPDEETRAKRKGGWQRKIEKLERERDVWREQALSTPRTTQQAPAPVATEEKPPVKPTRPVSTDFASWTAYEDALPKYEDAKDTYLEQLAEYKARQIVAHDRQQQQQKTEQQKVAEGFAAQITAAEKRYPDYREVAFRDDVILTPVMQEAIVGSEYGADIAYELGSHPEEAERIAALSPVAAVREIGKLESKLEARLAKTVAATPEAPAASAPATQSRAPRPPSPVKKASPTAAVDLNDPATPMDVWLRERNKQVHGQ